MMSNGMMLARKSRGMLRHSRWTGRLNQSIVIAELDEEAVERVMNIKAMMTMPSSSGRIGAEQNSKDVIKSQMKEYLKTCRCQ
jgi:hypothetical protein